MLFYSENETHINSECTKCGRVLRIKKEICEFNQSGFKLKTAISCPCGTVWDRIEGHSYDEVKRPLVQQKSSIKKSSIKCPTCQSTNIDKISTGKKLGYVAAFGIFAPAFKKVRSQFECKNCGYKW